MPSNEAGTDSGAEEPLGVADMAPGAALGDDQTQRQDYRYSTETVCENCGFRSHKSREECRALNQECFHCGRLRHFSKLCR